MAACCVYLQIWLNALQKDGGDGSLYNKAKDTDGKREILTC